VRRLIEMAKDRGIDVETWALTKSFQHLMGPAAEAKFLGKSFRTLWWGAAAADDRKYVVRDCGMAGVNSDDRSVSDAHLRTQNSPGRLAGVLYVFRSRIFDRQIITQSRVLVAKTIIRPKII
jgi:hypothetical protein